MGKVKFNKIPNKNKHHKIVGYSKALQLNHKYYARLGAHKENEGKNISHFYICCLPDLRFAKCITHSFQILSEFNFLKIY